MSDLLALAVEAHGGMQRWDEFKALRTELSVAGAIWSIKQQPGLLTDKIFEIETHAERLTITPFTGPDRRSVFVPDRLVLETLDGGIVETRDNPEAGLPARRLRALGTNSTSPISPAKPFGLTSRRLSSTPTLASRAKRSSRGMRTERNGAG
jgi:hypothetical protein